MINGTGSANSIICLTQLALPNEGQGDEVKNRKAFLYFDRIAKKFVGMKEDRIELFSKKCIKQNQGIKITLGKQQIQAITIEKNNEYLMVSAITRTQTKSILILSMRKGEVIRIIHIESSSNLKGMFFLSQSDDQMKLSSSTNFCLIFQTQIYFYSIDKETDDITTKHIVTYTNSIKIEASLYHQAFMINCIIRSDSSFDFYNYNNEAFYDKSFTLSYRKLKLENKAKLNGSHLSQPILFFLEVLHKELCFIVFDIDNSVISLHHVKKLNDVSKAIDVLLPKDIAKAMLLFVNDLLLVVNMSNWEITVIDVNLLAKDNKVIAKFTYTNPLEMELKSIQPLKANILTYEQQLFYAVNINYKALYDSFSDKSKHKCLLMLIEKKGTKDLFYAYFKEMIQKKHKAKYITEILYALVLQIAKSIKPPQEMLLSNKEDNRALEVIPPLPFLLKRHKRLIKQIDLFYLFQSLLDCIEVENDIMRYYMIFSIYCRANGIKLQPNFTSIMLVIIKRMHIEKCKSLFKILPENEELASYLLETAETIKNEFLKWSIKQRAFDILIKLDKKKKMMQWLIGNGYFKEALLFYVKYKLKVSRVNMKVILLGQMSNKKHKRIMLQFIQQSSAN